ncbi:MAG: amino acid permease [Proteobacteria bacterium]|nr:amino acid permease [Pseudomonadota bacterium]
MNLSKPKTKHALSLFSLVMITVGSVDSVRNLPATALFGSELVFFFFLGALFFLIPCALVSAELASGWPKQGGVYVWVKEAFGDRFGLLAIWFQWIENVIWYPAILSFVAGTVGYLIDPALASNKVFLVSVILSSFWGATIVNLLGMKSSARFSTFCTMAGLLLPMSLIIGLGCVWFFSDAPLQIAFTKTALLPDFKNPTMWVSLTGIILSFCGVEIATVHANDVHNPQHAFPRALLYSVLIILGTLVMGSLAIAVVVPQAQISLVAGIMQAFEIFFNAYHLGWLLPLVAVMLVIGGLGTVSNWIIAPTKGLLVAAKEGHLPPVLQKENRHGAPKTLLIAQAVIVSLLSLVFLLMPTVNASYWLLTALAAQLYMLMYLLMFAAGIYLRIKSPEQHRLFKIPGNYWGMGLVAGAGIIGCITTFCVGFIPPDNIQVGSILRYETLLISGLILMCLPPFITYRFRKSSWEVVTAA